MAKSAAAYSLLYELFAFIPFTNGTFFLCVFELVYFHFHIIFLNALCALRNTCNFVFINICYYAYCYWLGFFFVCASILALLFNRMYNCIVDIELKRQFKLNKKIILKMCNADVKINNGSSGFPTTFILFQPTTVFFILLCFYTTQMTIDAKSKNNPLHSWKQMFV